VDKCSVRVKIGGLRECASLRWSAEGVEEGLAPGGWMKSKRHARSLELVDAKVNCFDIKQ